MKILEVPAIGSTSIHGSHIDRQRLVNLYPVETKGRALRSVPGLEWVTRIGNGPVRGFADFGNSLLVASGASIYRMNAGYAGTSLGTVSDATGRVRMFTNGTQAMILDRTGEGFTYDGGNAIVVISDVDFQALRPTTGIFHDGYGIVNKRGTGEFYISGLYDFTTWNPLDFATAEAVPDNIVHLESDKSLLWVFGERTLEVYQNTGNADFPFEPLRSITSHFGAIPETIERIDNTLFWLGQSEHGGRVVVRLVSNADPVVISDEEVNRWLDSIPRDEYENVETQAIWYQGHSWYVVTFKTLDEFGRTIVFDSQTGAAFEWSGKYASHDTIGRIPFGAHVFWGNEHLVGDWATGDIYRLKGSNLNGERMLKQRIWRAVRANGQALKFPKVECEMETGDGTDDDTIALSVSFDGGRTWGNARTKSIGAQGEYDKRVTWWRCGRGRNTVFRLTTTADRDIEMTGLKVTAA